MMMLIHWLASLAQRKFLTFRTFISDSNYRIAKTHKAGIIFMNKFALNFRFLNIF